MSNYFLDTNVLVGYCYLQNRWQVHTKRLFDTDNTIHISELVLYEFCVKDNPGPPEDDSEIEWDSRAGIFGRVRRKLRKGKRHAELELRRYDANELTPKIVAEIFIEKFDIQDEVADKIKSHFKATLESDCNVRDARQEIDKLVNTITTTASERKENISDRVYCHQGSRNHQFTEKQLRRLIYGNDVEYGPDAAILIDALDLNLRGIVSKVVTGDKGDIYLNSDQINSMTGLTVLYLKDEFTGEVP